jgi:hypothetical protein
MRRRVTVPFDVVRTYSYIADIKRCDRDLVVLVPIHDFCDFASSDASISVTCLSRAFVFVCVVIATSPEFSSQRLMVVIYIRRE